MHVICVMLFCGYEEALQPLVAVVAAAGATFSGVLTPGWTRITWAECLSRQGCLGDNTCLNDDTASLLPLSSPSLRRNSDKLRAGYTLKNLPVTAEYCRGEASQQ